MRRERKERGKIDLQGFKQVFPKLISLAKEEWRGLTVGLIALSAASGLNLLFPAVIRSFLKGELGLSLENDLLLGTGILIALFAVQSICFYVRHLAFTSAGMRIVYRLRERLFAAILEKEVTFFDNNQSADLLSRLTSDCQLVQAAVSVNISVFLRYAIQVIGGLILMALISLKLTLLIAISVPCLVLATRFWGGKLQSASREMQDALGKSGVVAGERFSGIRIVKIFSDPIQETAIYRSLLNRAEDAALRRTKIAAEFSSSMVFVIYSAITLVFYVGAKLVFKNELQIGDLAAFLLYCAIVSASFGFLVGVIDELFLAVGGASRVFELIQRASPADIRTPFTVSYSEEAPLVEFKQVTFRYKGSALAAENPVAVENISLSIPKGKTVAVVGPSGSGKSTLLSLVARFYEPDQGEILYCGASTNQIPVGLVEKDLSIVTQNPILFSTTIKENIRYALPSASDNEIEEAAVKANLSELLTKLPEGLNSEVGEQGIKLSGGERQRVSIARAILKNPKLLLLDEATSALDSYNEHLVQEALDKLMSGRTTLVVAHRLSTIHNADQILVMQNGKIMERGSHDQLMADKGLYANLVQYQLL
jgi:ABC-type multidrug transport system fused ATPase/permease subunit